MKSGNKITRNLIQSLGDQIKLITRLMQDSRVNFFLKILPFGSLVYFISPFDFPTPIDDVGVIWFFASLFLELCPPDVVSEHQVAIEKENIDKRRERGEPVDFAEGDIVDAEFKDKED
jgi:hypothetical protein